MRTNCSLSLQSAAVAMLMVLDLLPAAAADTGARVRTEAEAEAPTESKTVPRDVSGLRGWAASRARLQCMVCPSAASGVALDRDLLVNNPLRPRGVLLLDVKDFPGRVASSIRSDPALALRWVPPTSKSETDLFRYGFRIGRHFIIGPVGFLPRPVHPFDAPWVIGVR